MERFGKYILVDKISSGGMADVYRAKVVGIRGFTKTVAIKRIHEHLLERTRFLRMFTDEAKIGIFLGSILAGVVGFTYLRLFQRRSQTS